MEAILTHLGQFVINLISSFGYLGVFVAMAIESACIPLPSEIILPFTGYMVFTGHLSFWPATVTATLGNLFGAMVAYYVGVWGGRPFLRRYGRYILFNEKELNKTERIFNRYGELTVFVGRILPIVRTFISLPAGIAKMNPLKVAIYSVLGAFPWCLALVYVGQKLGENWNNLKPLFHRMDIIVAGLIICGLIYWFFRRRKRK